MKSLTNLLDSPMTMSLLGVNSMVFFICRESLKTRNYYTQKYGFITSFAADGEYYRFLSFSFVHLDWDHFLSNMYCLQHHGTKLEKKLGSKQFALLMAQIFVFLGPVQLILTEAWSFFTRDHTVLYRRAIGFSGVLFAFKYLIYKDELCELSHLIQQGNQFTFEMIAHPIFELITTSIVYYNSSFAGHLAGIITGFLLSLDFSTWFKKYFAGPTFDDKKPPSTPKSSTNNKTTYRYYY